jgi:hypothetical protein
VKFVRVKYLQANSPCIVLLEPPLPPVHQTLQGLTELGGGVSKVDEPALQVDDFLHLIAGTVDVLVEHGDVNGSLASHAR